MKIKNILFFCIICFSSVKAYNQNDSLHLTLNLAVSLAQDSSLSAFQAKSQYMSSHWSYQSYRSSLLPALALNTNPVNYDKSIQRILNIYDTTYVTIENENLNSDFTMQVSQIVPWTAGKLSFISYLNRFEDFSTSQDEIDFSTYPFYITYSQPLLGYNPYKWEKKMQPLRYRQASHTFLQEREEIALSTVKRFFQLITAKKQLEMAEQNFHNADTLLEISKKRFEIGTLQKIELLTLEYDYVRSKTLLKQAQNYYQSTKEEIITLLRLPSSIAIAPKVPNNPALLYVDSQEAEDKAYEYNPTIEGFELELISRKAEVANAKSQKFLNSSSINLTYGLNKNDENLLDAYKKPNRRRQLEISLSIPIYNWGQKKEEYLLSVSQLETSMYSIENEKNTLNKNIKTIVNSINIQNEVVSNSLLSKKLANEAFTIAKARFIKGAMDVENMYILRNRSMNAEIEYIEQVRTYWELYYQLRIITMYDFNKDVSIKQDFESFDNFFMKN